MIHNHIGTRPQYGNDGFIFGFSIVLQFIRKYNNGTAAGGCV